MYPERVEVLTGPPRTPSAKLVKSYLKTILSNPESRKIFYFLMLNLCYMLIQMLYGVWTNSLGLISDGEPSLLSCLFRSLNLPQQYIWLSIVWQLLLVCSLLLWRHGNRTRGILMGVSVSGILATVLHVSSRYGRIETLSGFANGIFLILISIFIIFEAMQRLYVVLSRPFQRSLLTLYQNGTSRDEHEPASAGQLPWTSSQLVWDVCYGRSPPSCKSRPRRRFRSGPKLTPISQGGHSHSSGHSHSHSFSIFGNDNSHAEHSHGPALYQARPHDHDHSCEGHSHSQGPSPPTQRDHSRVDEHRRSHLSDNCSHGHHHHHEEDHCSQSCLKPPALQHDLNHHHGRSQSQSPANDHSAHSRSHSPGPPPSHSHSHSQPHSPHETMKRSRGDSPNLRASSPIPSISVHLANLTVLSSTSTALTPITPSYTFGHDEHNTKYHLQDHSHSHGHGHGHEGHSHNMRGVFLHVMAVSAHPSSALSFL